MSSNQWPTTPVTRTSPSAGGYPSGPPPSGTGPMPMTGPGAGFGPMTGPSGPFPPNSYPTGLSTAGSAPTTQPAPQPRKGGALKVVLGLLGVLLVLGLVVGGLYWAGVLPGVGGPGSAAQPQPPAALRYADHVEINECRKDERIPFFPTFNVGMRVTNKGTDSATYLVTTEIVDAAGTRLDEFNDKATRLAPGQTTVLSHPLLRDVPAGAKCNVVKVERIQE